MVFTYENNRLEVASRLLNTMSTIEGTYKQFRSKQLRSCAQPPDSPKSTAVVGIRNAYEQT